MATRSIWAPLDLGDFCSAVEQQQYIQFRKWLGTACSSLLARASPYLEANLAQCQSKLCTIHSCPYHTGCVMFTAQTLLQTGSPTDVTMEWCNLLSLAAFKRHKLLHAALTYDRSSEVCVLVLIPTDVLAPLLKPESLPGVGVFGVGTVPLTGLAKGLVNLCFQEVMVHLPEGVAKIEPHMLPLDPTDPNKLPPVSIVNMDPDGLHGPPHGSLPVMPWGSETGYEWPAPAGIAKAATMTTDQLDQQQQQPQQQQQQESNKQPIQQLDQAAVDPEHSKDQQLQGHQGLSGELSAASLPPDLPLAPSQQRLYLQSTINKFWMTVGGMGQRLTNRVRKIRCRERVACDGVGCQWCRGAMVFTVAGLEGPTGRPWSYSYRGGETTSNTPKQYIRGEWRTVYELVRGLGSLDIELIRTVTIHDRRQGYVQALHVPRHLVADCLPHTPPAGLIFWRLCEHSPIGGPGLSPRGLAPEPLKPIHSEYSYKSACEDVEPNYEENGGFMPRETALCAEAGPRRCCASDCAVTEQRFTGVQLLVCSGCKVAAYCTPEHQRAHWRAHKPQCSHAALAAEPSEPTDARQKSEL